MYIPEIKFKGYDRYITVYVGDVKVGEFFENEDTDKMLDRMFAKLIRGFFESEGVNFYEEDEEDEDW